MDGLNRTGGQHNVAAQLAAANNAASTAANKARMEAVAAEAAKYRLPGMALGEGSPEPGQKPAPVAPMNLAQLRSWIEHSGSIDIYA